MLETIYSIIFLITLVLCCFSGCTYSFDKIQPNILADLVSSKADYNTLLIEENGTEVPYLVVRRNENSSVLLLRKEPFDKKIAYNVIQPGFTSYYPDSNLDRYLNEEFVTFLSEYTQSILLNNEISVTTFDTIVSKDGRRDTETIQRKIYVLSATEFGIKSASSSKEGSMIPGLEQYVTIKEEWLRTPNLADKNHVWVVNTEVYHIHAFIEKYYFRPAFSLPGEIPIVESSGGAYKLAKEQK